jgi:hypothetical protein
MYEPHFELATFESLPTPQKLAILEWLVEGLAIADGFYLAANPDLPPLYDATRRYGLRYEFNKDHWRDIPTVLRARTADCKDLSAWRIADLRREAAKRGASDDEVRTIAKPHFTIRQQGKLTIYHVQVEGPHGIEDPSCALGMPASTCAAVPKLPQLPVVAGGHVALGQYRVPVGML